MEGIKHSRQFAETESLMDNYFVCHIVPVMKQTQAYLNEKQGEEMKEYSTSIGGMRSMMATAGQPLGDPYQTLKVTGEWNSKTTEDYIAMCREKIVSSDEMQHDLACIPKNLKRCFVRLACVRHAASVHPEPGSNSQIKCSRCQIKVQNHWFFSCHYCLFRF